MKDLKNNNPDPFDLLKLVYGSDAYLIGLDAEWYESGGKNTILSYQLAVVSDHGSASVMITVPPGQRKTLAELVEGRHTPRPWW